MARRRYRCKNDAHSLSGEQMSAIAWELPEEIRAVREGLLEFARQEVLTRHEKHHDLFENPRRLYREDGRFSDELKGLIGEVRRAASTRSVRYTAGGSVSISNDPVNDVIVVARYASGCLSSM